MATNFDNEALRAKYNPEGSQLRRDQMELLKMLCFVADICDANGIEWWLSSGTLLGAARHEGFIPWDDDIDFVMLRKDYDKLVQIADKEFEAPYFFQTVYSDKDF